MCSFSRLKAFRCLLYQSDSNLSKIICARNYQIKKIHEPKEFSDASENTRKNKLYIWGFALTGALGDVRVRGKRNKVRHLKRPAYKIFPHNEQIHDVACGLGFSIYALQLPSGSKLFGSGLNTDGQLGHQSVRGPEFPLEVVYSTVPIRTPVPLHKNEKIIRVAAGRTHALALTSRGIVFAFGNNDFGQCGRAIVKGEDYKKYRDLWIPKVPCEEGDKVIDVVCGLEHSFFLTESGKVYSCGNGSDGQTGLGNYKNNFKPTLVEGDIKNEKIVKISSSTDTVLALNDKGEVFGWGNSEYSQLPLTTRTQQLSTPQHLLKLQTIGKMKDVASSGTVSMALTECGDVYVWGYGILGKGIDFVTSEEPSHIPNTLFGRTMFNPDSTVVSLNCGVQSLAAITDKGELFMWGQNKSGQLGLGHTFTQYYPLNVSIGARVIRVACGMDHTIAMCRSF